MDMKRREQFTRRAVLLVFLVAALLSAAVPVQASVAVYAEEAWGGSGLAVFVWRRSAVPLLQGWGAFPVG